MKAPPPIKRQRKRRWIWWTLALLAMPVVAAVFAIETSVHIAPWQRVPPDTRLADRAAADTGAAWRAVSVTAVDGTVLRGWLFEPARGNGHAVILLHGIADTRSGVLGHARMLLRNGYATLLPDSRGHGESGGPRIGYGVLESADVRSWVDWLSATTRSGNVFALGESMGGAIVLQSLMGSPAIRAAVAESPFATFRDVAYDRIGGHTHVGPVGARLLFWWVVEPTIFYGRLRYDIDLNQASPLEALRNSTTPVLLIHGMRDQNILHVHSERLHELYPGRVDLWTLPDGGHTTALGEQPAEFTARVTSFFAKHARR